MFIILLTYTKPLTEIDKHLVAHRTFLQKYYDSGDLVCSGPQNPRTGGVILARTKNKTHLEQILSGDPFKQNNVADYQIIEFEAVKFSENFKACL